MTEVCDWFPNGLRLTDDMMNEIEREGLVRLEPGHHQWLRDIVPLDVHHLPSIVAETSPRLERQRKDRARRLKKIAKLANLLLVEIDAEIADTSRVNPSLYGNLSRIDKNPDLSNYASTIRRIVSAASLQQTPHAKKKGPWSPYAPYKTLVLQFAEIYANAGGTPSTAWSDSRGNRCGPFWRAFEVICRQLPVELRTPRSKNRTSWLEGLAEHANNNNWFKDAQAKRGKK